MHPITLCMLLYIIAIVINLATRSKMKVYVGLFLAILSTSMLLIGAENVPDQENYRHMFDSLTINNFHESITDLGYAFLNGFIKMFTNNYWVFLFIINCIAMPVVFMFFNKYSKYIAISWAYYFSLYLGFNLVILRQGLAIAITLYSFQYILSESRNKFLMCILVASLLHFSAVLFIPAYWIANRIDITKRNAYILLAATLPLVFIDFLGFFIKFAGFCGIPEWSIRLYLETDSDMYERAGLSMGLIVRMIFFLGFAISADLRDRIQQVLFNLYWAYLIIYFPSSSVSMISARGLDYYKIFECLTIPYAILNLKQPLFKLGYTLLVILFFVYSTFNQYSVYYKKGSLSSLLQDLLNYF